MGKYPDSDEIAKAWSLRGDNNEEQEKGSHYIDYFRMSPLSIT